MGWDFGYGDTRKDVIARLTKGFENEKSKYEVEKYCMRGNVMYALAASTNKETGVTTRFIAVNLLGKSNGDWGYKSMDETCGPYYYDCPLGYLDAASEPENETAADWRATVREKAAKKAEERKANKLVLESAEPGARVFFWPGLRVKGIALVGGTVVGKSGTKISVRADGIGLVNAKAKHIKTVYPA